MSNLSGKIAVITGGSRGIGSAIAKKLGKEGASVILVFSKDLIGATETKEYIESIGGFCKIVQKDISKAQNCKEIIDEVVSNFGKLDILINNAAISNIGLLMDIDEEEVESLINTNLLGAIYLSKQALNYMTKKGNGNIINISSIWGNVGASCEVIYSTAKGGINSFTKALAKEVAPFGIRVNAIAPGVINTKMNNFLSEEEKADIIDGIPMGRFGEVNEIAEVALFLCKEASSYLTGQIITVDGGML